MKLYFCALLWALFSFLSPVFAQPTEQTLGQTVADRQHVSYRFEVLKFTSADNERHYLVTVGIPKANAPDNGFPVFYALDGNAALAQLNDVDLHTLAQNPSVLVFIGHDNGKDFDFAARAYDYTFSTDGIDKKYLDENRKNGGADAYFALIQNKIMPAVEALVAVDKSKQTLWGHSYGGLFVLYTLYTKPLIFRTYIAADPSLWWGGAKIMTFAENFKPKHSDNLNVIIEKSGKKRPEKKTEALTAEQQQRLAKRKQMLSSLPNNANETIINDLQNSGIQIEQIDYPELTHGAVFGASLRKQLQLD